MRMCGVCMCCEAVSFRCVEVHSVLCECGLCGCGECMKCKCDVWVRVDVVYKGAV